MYVKLWSAIFHKKQNSNLLIIQLIAFSARSIANRDIKPTLTENHEQKRALRIKILSRQTTIVYTC